MLSQKTRYALKALLELAEFPAGDTLSSAAISARRAIPVKFLEAILVELKRGGLVRGQRGRGGGYQLAKSTAEISFGDVVRLMEGPLALLPCVSVTQYHRCADCADDRTCEIRRLFHQVRDSTAAILDGWTLADARGNGGSADAHPGATPGTSLGTDSSTNTGTKTSTKTGTNSGTNSRTNTGTNTGTNSGTNSGANSGTTSNPALSRKAVARRETRGQRAVRGKR